MKVSQAQGRLEAGGKREVTECESGVVVECADKYHPTSQMSC